MAALYLAIRIPQLALEIFHSSALAAVVEDQKIIACSAQAQASGVAAGLPLAAALALATGLLLHERQPQREAQALQRLACWAGNFTPSVSVCPPHELLLEIGSCLRLFGGQRKMLAQIHSDLLQQGHTPQWACAPTPLAAQWLARRPDQTDLGEDWFAHLRALPLSVMQLPSAQLKTLLSLGVSRIGDLYALPAAGLARRCGPDLPLRLAQARGQAADLRPPFIFPEHFAQELELPALIDDKAMLHIGAMRLLHPLAGWLSARAAGISQCELQLVHGRSVPPSCLSLRFSSLTRDIARMERVLHENLQSFTLPQPAIALRLQADAAQALAGHNLSLLAQAGPASGSDALDSVLERLRARLGEQAVYGLALRPEHRPECASQKVASGQAPSPQPGPPRPLWLLAQARELSESAVRRLQLLAGPERIESGWWDAGESLNEQAQLGDCRRDYYVAVSPQGQWWWIYRNAQGWWQQGIFA